MNKKMLVVVLLALALPTVAAMWLENISITGTVETVNGSRPEMEEFFANFNITNNDNYSAEFSHYLKDTEADFIFSLDDSLIQSTDENCTYHSGFDLAFYIYKDGNYTFFNQSGSDPVHFEHGWNNFNLTVDPHPNMCPLYGDYSVWTETD